MSHLFTATVRQKRDLIVVESTACVYYPAFGNSADPVACIQDFCDPADHRRTTITFAEGALHFAAAYDGPIRPYIAWDFEGKQHISEGISLHCFPKAGQFFLCCPAGVFAIHTTRADPYFSITIYNTASAPQENGLFSPVLATIRQTSRFEDGFEYTIQVEDPLPVPTLMAIFSLPFTIPYLCD